MTSNINLRQVATALLFPILFVLLSFSCAKRVERVLIEPKDLAAGTASKTSDNPYLKAHLRDGQVCVFSEWLFDTEAKRVLGTGQLFSINRIMTEEGEFDFSLDDVAIFETNRLLKSPAASGMAVITGLSVALSIGCAINPKMCFGSCPTFYISDGDGEVLQAEGFSASVAPILEASDTDVLYRAKPSAREFEVVMRNEALETHVVRSVDLLCAPKVAGGRVLMTPDNQFWQTASMTSPTRVVGPEGECLSLLREFDGRERVSEADAKDLATREQIELEFDTVPAGDVGLVIALRQTLLTTYLFYQALAYMGSSVGEWFAKLESEGERAWDQVSGVAGALGGVDVFVQDDKGDWVQNGMVRETGPLATNVFVVPLHHTGPMKIRLRLSRGAWRLDYVGLASLVERVEPVRMSPMAVLSGGEPDAGALRQLHEPAEVLTTFPGDVYTIVFDLPENFENLELFLDSRGYYLEWMREAWLAEEDPARAAMMLLQPETALRVLAPEFKQVEAQMEKIFWESRYAQP